MIAEANALLRAQGRYAIGADRGPYRHLGALIALGGFGYGLAMGSYSARAGLSLFSGTKVPLLLLVSTAVCLPSFFVLNAILGLSDDFGRALRAILSSQATMAIALLALAPLTLTAYASSDSYRFAVQFNGLQFLLGASAGQVMMARHYRPLVRSNPRHATARRLWLTLYLFVAIQLAWVLRPFVGAPGMQVRFFRESAWSNAYVVLVRDVFGIGS